MKYPKTKHPHRTKTRAAIDRCVFDVYYELVDRDHVALSEIMERHRLGWHIVKDLRELGYVVSTGRGRGQTHSWVGAPPTVDTGDAIEKLRAKRQRDLRKRQEERARQTEERLRALVRPCPTPEQLTPTAALTSEQRQRAIDRLLEERSKIDAQLSDLSGQTRLF
jgi:hypothetical protein